MNKQFLLASTTLVLVGAATGADLPPPAKQKVDFIRDVEPILTQKCHSCHGEDVRQAGLRLDRRQQAMRGGDYGPVIVPGNSAESKLIRRLVDGDGGLVMPPTGALSTDEIALLRAWIDQGADFRIDVKAETPAKPVDPKVQAWIATVRSNDLEQVREILAANPEAVKASDNSGSTLLHHAAGFGSVAVVELLLEKGANPNAKNRRGSTPLLWSIHDKTKVRLLIDRGASVNEKMSDGRSPLFQAAMLGDGLETCRMLLDAGADPQAATANLQTPLMAAASRGNVDTMRLLIAKKADVNAANAAGSTALMSAASSGVAEAVRLLLENGANPNAATKKNETALADAATSGNEESVRLLMDHGAKVNVSDTRGYSPLMYAAASEIVPVGVVKLLLAKGADTSVTGEGETARSLAAKRGDTEIARLLGVPEEERRLGAVAAPPAVGDRKRSIPEAVGKATALLEKQSHNFIRIGGCNSCHNQDLPSAAAALARQKGLPAPEAIAQLGESQRGTSPTRVMDFNVINVASVSWELFDFGMNQKPPTEYTDAVVRYIKAMQTPSGRWSASYGRRPPMNAGEFQTAALAIYALLHYSPKAESADTEDAVARAAAWLQESNPESTQDRAFHVLGLAWAKAGGSSVKRAASALSAAQRADGGWSQLPGMGSDAYATGQALFALSAAGAPKSDPVFQKGVEYLRRTQADDGSWHVKTRAIWFQPYFESGFPYGHDQWISVAGTAWASMALSTATGEQTAASR